MLANKAIFVLLAIFPAISWADTIAPITAAEAKSVLEAALITAKDAPAASIQVRAVSGCYPLVNAAPTDFLCLVEMSGHDGLFRVREIAFRKVSGSWSLLDPDESYDPACPSAKEAEALFRKTMYDSTLRVTEIPAEGTISDTRGKNQDKTGPHRLLCTYILERELGEVTAVGYFTYEKGRYLLDPDPEIWR